MENKPTSSPNKASGRILTAVIFVLVGVLMLARNLGLIDPMLFRILVSWQMLLIVIGLYLTTNRNKGGGVILIIVGACMLLPKLNFFGYTLNFGTIMWPVMFVLIGIFLLTRPKHCSGRGRRGREAFASSQCDSSDGFVNSYNTFGGVKQVVLDEVFKGASIRNNFGGTVLDLRRTSLAPGETYVDLECNFGGVEIYVPLDWKVSVQADAFIGGCEDKRLPGVNIDHSRVLVIRGNVSFGGVEIKS